MDNLCLIIDDNDSAGAMVDLGNMQERLTAFGFDVTVTDGHDMDSLEKTFSDLLFEKNGRPKAVIAKTIRGYGSPTMTDHDIWFHKAPNAEELALLEQEVDAF